MVLTRWIGAAGVYRDRRVASLFFFGFSSGLPLALTGATLAAWFTESGMSLTEIGLVGLIGIAYALKFLWSPLVDRLPIPFLCRILGRRRGWMLASQLAVVGALAALAVTDPASVGAWTVICAVAVAFASATQDIVIDAYRTEILEPEKLGAGAAMLVFGYRVAMVVSGGGALVIAGFAGWFWAYGVMALLMAVGIAATIANPEPEQPSSGVQDVPAGRNGGIQQALVWFHGAVVRPFAEFMTRPGWVAVLLFVALYKYGDALLGVMATPFYLYTGFSLAEIGVVTKGFGLAMTLAGTAIGGVLVARFGIIQALLIAGLLQAASNLVFCRASHDRIFAADAVGHHQCRKYHWRYGNHRFRGLSVQPLQSGLYGDPVCLAVVHDGGGAHILCVRWRLGGGADRLDRLFHADDAGGGAGPVAVMVDDAALSGNGSGIRGARHANDSD